MSSNHSHEHHHEVHHSHKKEYIIIFFVLAILTVLELLVPGLKNVSHTMKAVTLVLLALAKAFLVAYSYMHLKSETNWLKFIAAIPLSIALFTLVLVLESIYR